MSEESMLVKMKASLKGRAGGANGYTPVKTSESNDEISTTPVGFKQLRWKAVPRRSRWSEAVGPLIVYVLLVLIALIAFCCFDLSEYQHWATATEVLSDLRKVAGNQERADQLVQLAVTVDREHVDLKSGLLGVLALRKMGFGEIEGGLQNCQQICQQYPASWFAGQFSREKFNSSCSACALKGSLPSSCYSCKGSGKCVRCKGSGQCASFGGYSRPSGKSGNVRNTGIFHGMGDANCLDCKGSMKCRTCAGQGTMIGSCSQCGGKGGQFSKQVVIEQYKAVIDNVMGLHPSWVATVVRLQLLIKAYLPFV